MSTLKDGSLAGSRVPSDKQKAYGNYEKGHRVLHGMRLSIENAAGTERHGKDDTGKPWKQKLSHDYGYIRGTTGKDKDHIDAFIGPDADDRSLPVWVIDQDKKGGGSVFDEHKCMVGFKDEADAIMAYHRNYEPGWDGFRAATPMDIDTFRDWAYAGRSGKRKPASEYAAFKEQSDGKTDDKHGTSGVFRATGGQDPGNGGQLREQHGHGNEQHGQRVQLPAGWDHGPGALPRSDGYRAQPRMLGREAGGPERDAQGNRRLYQGPAEAGGGYASGGPVRGAGGNPQSTPDPLRLGQAAKRGSLAARLAAKRAGQGGYADGGSVGSERGDDQTGPFIGYRSPRRRESANDRSAAASNPASLLRGVLAGTAGLPGDLEGIGRTVARAVDGNQVAETLGRAIPGLGLLQKALGSSEDTTPRLPTSEFYNEYLPARAEGKSNRAAEFTGNMAGLLPNEVAGVTRAAAREVAPVVKGALTRLAENAAAPTTLSKQAGAVKLPGGNWMPGSPEEAIRQVVGFSPDTLATMAERNRPMPVENWMAKRLGKYIKNDLGTAKDPLLALEKEGRMHLSPETVMDNARIIDNGKGREWMNFQERPIQIPEGTFGGDSRHHELTGRDYKTPWEVQSDSAVERLSASRAAREAGGLGNRPDWLTRLGNENPGADVYKPDYLELRGMGFDHVKDYLDAATGAHKSISRIGGLDAGREYIAAQRALGNNNLGPSESAVELASRNLHIDPAGLDKMSLPDVIRKTADWNDYMAQAKKMQDMNKGIKEVLKQYPDTGHQWVELDPEGLKAEGDVMGHCVGGYCSSVEGGDTRILSLRDKSGQPHVTVELGRGVEFTPDGVENLPREYYGAAEQRAEDRAIAEGFSPDHPDWDEVLAEMHIEELEQSVKDFNATQTAGMPWNIHQIKGKQNKAPVDEYLPAVQDLVRNMGPWGDTIGDLYNTGLVRSGKNFFSRSEIPQAIREHPHFDLLQRAYDSDPERFKNINPAIIDNPASRSADMMGILNGLNNEAWVQRHLSAIFNKEGNYAVGGSVAKAAVEGIGHLRGLVGRLVAERAAPAAKPTAQQLERQVLPVAPGLKKQMGAVKMPGGNWMESGTKNPALEITGTADGLDPSPASKWLEKRLPKYIKNQMGTATDPLLQLEKEGALHLDPERLRAAADNARENNFRMTGGRGQHAEEGLYPGDETHERLTGRRDRTAWELLSDAPITVDKAGEIAKGEYVTPDHFSHKVPADTDVYDTRRYEMEGLGFDHLYDYVDQATRAHKTKAKLDSLAPDVRAQLIADGGNGIRPMMELVERNLHIDPAKLDTMSFPDMVRKSSDWNKYLAQAKELKDVNKGIKSVMKQYPDTGHQWVELDPAGLGDEGKAMGHCVGGYCNSVAAGKNRILSLRDKKGQPHVTVELGRPSKPVGMGHVGEPWYDRAVAAMEADALNKDLPDHSFWRKLDELASSNWDEDFAAGKFPWDIRQIKGKQNAAPVADYIPAVQDLVKNMGPWGDKVRDLENTGLIRHGGEDLNGMDPAYLARQFGIKAIPPKGFYTREELSKAVQEANPDADLTDALEILTGGARGDFRRGGYAQGGTVTNRQTVGLGSFGQGQAQEQPQQQAGGWGFGMTAPQQQNAPAGGLQGSQGVPANRMLDNGYQLLPGMFGALDTDNTGGTPSRTNAPTFSDKGVDAYMNNYASDFDRAWKENENNPAGFMKYLSSMTPEQIAGQSRQGRSILAEAMDPALRMQISAGNAGAFLGGNNFMTGQDGQALPGADKYYSVAGMSSGWDGSNNARGSSQTLYKRENGQLIPMTTPRTYTSAERPGFWRSAQGADLLGAISMIAPAFGGWAGLAGQAAGTTGATVANIAGNAALGYVGGGTQGALSSLAGGLGGMAGGAAGNYMGSGWGQAGQQIGSQAGKYLYNQNRQS